MEEKIIDRLIQQRVDGIIISPAVGKSDNIAVLERIGVPYVIIERPIENDAIEKESYDLFTIDNKYDGYLATKYLLDKGHRKIGFIGWKSEVKNLEGRLYGYKSALLEKEVLVNDKNIMEGENTEEEGYTLAKEMVEKNDVTAIVWAHHILAAGGLIYFRGQGTRLPEDISNIVIGTPDWTHVYNPSITCINQQEGLVGKEAALRLLEKIDDPESSVIQKQIRGLILEGNSVKNI